MKPLTIMEDFDIMDEQLRKLYSDLLDSMIKTRTNVSWDENVEIWLTENDKFEIRIRSRTGIWLVLKEKNKEQMLEWFENQLRKN